MGKVKKKPLKTTIKQFPKTVAGWFKKDENGKTNKVAATCFIFACIFPLVLVEGIKLGIYSKYTLETNNVVIMFNGLIVPLIKVLMMRKQSSGIGFGSHTVPFNPAFLEVFLFAYVTLFAMLFIAADRNKDKDNKKDGDMKFGNIDEFNREMAYCDDFGDPTDPPEKSNDPGNMILSKRLRYRVEPKGTGTYSCAIVIGATGSFKTLSYVKPNLLQMRCSEVVTDPKGELTTDLGRAYLENGYTVKVFNINEPEYSCKYNPFHYIRTEEDVISAVNVFLDNTKEQDAGSGDPFFPLAEKNFYLALFFYIFTVYKDEPEKQTFKTIYEIYQGASEQEVQLKKGEQMPDSPFDTIFKELAKTDPSNPSLGYYSTFKKGSNKTKQSILISVGVKLWFMAVPSIANLLSGDTLDLDKIGDRKTVVFVIIPSEKKTFRFLSAMLFTQMFETLYYVGNTLNEKSWLLQYGDCVAIRSEPFIGGTDSETTAKQNLELMREKYISARIEDDNERMLTDEKVKAYFDTPDKYGIKPFPKVRLIYKNADGKDEVLEEFQSRKACEMVKEAAELGSIVPGVKQLTNHVRFMLDEFFNIGVIPDFDMKIATFRSLRISASIIIQSIAQLKEMYEDREAKITNNCSIQILLGAGSLEDCQYFSDLIGQTTVRTESVSLNHKGLIQGADNSNISDGAKMLLRPEQIRVMNKDKCLIVVNTKYPIQDDKYEAFSHPKWSQTFSSHDIEKTIQNRFEFRRMFHIEQKEENKIVTVLPDDCSPRNGSSSRDNSKKKNPVSGIDPDSVNGKDMNPDDKDLNNSEEHADNTNVAPNDPDYGQIEPGDKVIVDSKTSFAETNAAYQEAVYSSRQSGRSDVPAVEVTALIKRDGGTPGQGGNYDAIMNFNPLSLGYKDKKSTSSSESNGFKPQNEGSNDAAGKPTNSNTPRYENVKENQVSYDDLDPDLYDFS